jgi:hypothetical protein
MRLSREGKFIAACLLAAVALIVATALLTPSANQRDGRPTSFNTGDEGLKAAFLALPALGYPTARWERPASDLGQVDAAKTVLVIANPQWEAILSEAEGVKEFARRGGWVLATGLGSATMLLPGADKIGLSEDGCQSEPEGLSTVARAGHLHFERTFEWKKDRPADLEYAQSCGDRAAVLLLPMGKGGIVLWSEAAPLTNAGAKKTENLRLLLASLPPAPRTVLFDEYVHGYQDYLWSKTSDTPVQALEWQLALVAALLIFSFARRHGPRRELATRPRTSPLEFAHSMGSVYHRAGAGEAAVEQARRSLLEFFERRCGFGRELLDSGPEVLCAALEDRFGYRCPWLVPLLAPAEGRIRPAVALKRVLQLNQARAEIGRIVNQHPSTTEKKDSV